MLCSTKHTSICLLRQEASTANSSLSGKGFQRCPIIQGCLQVPWIWLPDTVKNYHIRRCKGHIYGQLSTQLSHGNLKRGPKSICIFLIVESHCRYRAMFGLPPFAKQQIMHFTVLYVYTDVEKSLSIELKC